MIQLKHLASILLTPVMVSTLIGTILVSSVQAQPKEVTAPSPAPKAAVAADPLASWNDGKAKQSILDFVKRVTAPGTKDFVPEAERIATFDNDGTLWAEQPLYFQFLFAVDRVKALAPEHPEWKDNEPFASLLSGDMKGALAGGEKALMEIVAATHAGMTTDDFEKVIKDWLATAKHPTTKRPYTEMTYQPMIELLTYLRANGFKTCLLYTSDAADE